MGIGKKPGMIKRDEDRGRRRFWYQMCQDRIKRIINLRRKRKQLDDNGVYFMSMASVAFQRQDEIILDEIMELEQRNRLTQKH